MTPNDIFLYSQIGTLFNHFKATSYCSGWEQIQRAISKHYTERDFVEL